MAKAKREVVNTLRVALWGGVLVAGAAMVLGAMQRKEQSAVNEIIVKIEPLLDGNFLISEEDIPAILEDRFAHPITSFPIGKLDVGRLERVLEEDPFVLSAEAFVDARNNVRIELIQREPILRVIDNNKLNYYLDKDGNQMPPSEHYAARVRIASGNIPPYEDQAIGREENLLHQVFELNERLRADPFLDALIEQIYVNKRGELVLSPKVGKQTILFGRYYKADDKLSRLKTFYREGLPYKGWQAYSSFDLRYDGQVVCKKR